MVVHVCKKGCSMSKSKIERLPPSGLSCIVLYMSCGLL